MKTTTNLPRRDFIKLSAISGAFLAVGFVPLGEKESKIVNLSKTATPGNELNPFVFIGTDGKVVLYNHRPEMGQGTFQAIPMIIAEELEVDINDIEIRQSPADEHKYGDQMVVGSRSIRNNFNNMRKMGAAAREMLMQAAAKRFHSDVSECEAKNGYITHVSSGRKISYGVLVRDASELEPSNSPALKDPSQFSVIGKSVPRMDIPLKTNGEAKFGIDHQVEGMLYASVERSPFFAGRVIDYFGEKALQVPGVKYIFKTSRDVWGKKREAVAVLANSYWAAVKGRKALEIMWHNGDLKNWTTEEIWIDYYKASKEEGTTFEEKGDFENIFDKSANKIEAYYETPYQAHAPMEPMNAMVSVTEDKIEFWGSTQNPNGIRSHLAEKFGMHPDKIIINYTFMGGGFGRRSLMDVVDEVADLSAQAGVPVKVIWTREDDIGQGPFRACSLNHLRGSINAEGNAECLDHKIICQDIRNQSGYGKSPSSGITGGVITEYEIPNFRLNGVLRKHHIPITYWRSVYHSTNCFAHESFIDEMAHEAGKDPLDFRLVMLKNHYRYSQVLKLVAEKSDWYKTPDENTGRGVAIVERSGSFVALVAEVKRIEGKIVPYKFTVAIDCGIVINPDTVVAQSEGCVVMGLTAAYKSAITIEEGRVAQTNFDKFKLMELYETPQVNVHIVQSNEAPEGVGEAALPPTAPALTNAIFSLTGKRIRRLPFKLDEV